jgi:hypothetical protein
MGWPLIALAYLSMFGQTRPNTQHFHNNTHNYCAISKGVRVGWIQHGTPIIWNRRGRLRPNVFR